MTPSFAEVTRVTDVALRLASAMPPAVITATKRPNRPPTRPPAAPKVAPNIAPRIAASSSWARALAKLWSHNPASSAVSATSPAAPASVPSRIPRITSPVSPLARSPILYEPWPISLLSAFEATREAPCALPRTAPIIALRTTLAPPAVSRSNAASIDVSTAWRAMSWLVTYDGPSIRYRVPSALPPLAATMPAIASGVAAPPLTTDTPTDNEIITTMPMALALMSASPPRAPTTALYDSLAVTYATVSSRRRSAVDRCGRPCTTRRSRSSASSNSGPEMERKSNT